MGMHDDWNLYILFECLYEVVALLRAHDASHIFDADGLHAHLLHLSGHFDVGVQRVDGADREADRAARVRAGLERFIHGNLDVTQIVERIEDADDVNAVFHALRTNLRTTSSG